MIRDLMATTPESNKCGGQQSSTSINQLRWLDRLQTPEIAAWAVQAARGIMLGLLGMAPRNLENTGLDPLQIFKQSLDHPEFSKQ